MHEQSTSTKPRKLRSFDLDKYWLGIAKRAARESLESVCDHTLVSALITLGIIAIAALLQVRWLGFGTAMENLKIVATSVLAGALLFIPLLIWKLLRVPCELDAERQEAIEEAKNEGSKTHDELSAMRVAHEQEIAALSGQGGTSYLSLLRARQKLENELQPLLEVEDAGIKTRPTVQIGKDESDYRRDRIRRLRRDIEDISKQLELAKTQGPELTGEILYARHPTRIVLHRGQKASVLLLKLRLSTRTDFETTIRRANLTVESNGISYEGERQPVDETPVTFHHPFGGHHEETPTDLLAKFTQTPIRYLIGSEGWLQFYVPGLPDSVGIADLLVSITDDVGGRHLIVAKSFSID